MNQTFRTRRPGRRCRRRIAAICLSLVALAFLSAHSLATTLAPDSPNNPAFPTKPASALVAPNFVECLSLIQGTDHISPALVESVARLLNHPETASQRVPDQPPSFIAVTWREKTGQIRDVVVQACYNPTNISPGPVSASPSDATSSNADGYVHARLGGEFSSSMNQFLGLVYDQAVWFGPRDQVSLQQRAFQAALNGDMTLMQEQTVDPMRLLVVMPRGGTFLPTSLRSRVHGLVLNATLEFGTWHGQAGLVTDDAESAEQVAAVLSAWRDMAISLADTFASHKSGDQIRQALQSSSVQVVANRVLASGSVETRTVARASKELAAHTGGCPTGGVCSSDTVAICHKQPGRPNQTICVPPAAVASHLAAGDLCGPCSQ
ncbi:MAG TPA: hypothetical protein VMP11_05625 [Verrucomicrobiae bacterium]|nr:hypothetical protein [Verrucomicrobiae bacterium]